MSDAQFYTNLFTFFYLLIYHTGTIITLQARNQRGKPSNFPPKFSKICLFCR